jgi:hypothetical protein
MPNFIQQLFTPRQSVPSLDDELGLQQPLPPTSSAAPRPLGYNPMPALQPFKDVAQPKGVVVDSTGDTIQFNIEQPWKKAQGAAGQRFGPEDFEA